MHAYSALAETFMPSNAAAVLVLEDVQSALLFSGAGPAPGPLVLALRHRVGTRPAANTGITAVVQGIIRDRVADDEPPDVAPRPTQQRVDLHQVELGVPLDHAGGGAVAGLVAADGADPGVEADHGPPQRQDFAVM